MAGRDLDRAARDAEGARESADEFLVGRALDGRGGDVRGSAPPCPPAISLREARATTRTAKVIAPSDSV